MFCSPLKLYENTEDAGFFKRRLRFFPLFMHFAVQMALFAVFSVALPPWRETGDSKSKSQKKPSPPFIVYLIAHGCLLVSTGIEFCLFSFLIRFGSPTFRMFKYVLITICFCQFIVILAYISAAIALAFERFNDRTKYILAETFITRKAVSNFIMYGSSFSCYRSGFCCLSGHILRQDVRHSPNRFPDHETKDI